MYGEAGAEETLRDDTALFGGGGLPRQFQRRRAALRELELLRLAGLFCLQGQKLVGRLHGLQSAGGRLALAYEVGHDACIGGDVLRHLRLHLHGGLQAIERVLPALVRILVHLVAAHGRGVLLRIQLRELLVHVLHLERQPLRLRDELLGVRQVRAQLADHVERQARQVASLVDKHLRLVLELVDLVSDHFHRAHGGQRVLHEVGRIDDDPLRLRRGGNADQPGDSKGERTDAKVGRAVWR